MVSVIENISIGAFTLSLSKEIRLSLPTNTKRLRIVLISVSAIFFVLPNVLSILIYTLLYLDLNNLLDSGNTISVDFYRRLECKFTSSFRL